MKELARLEGLPLEELRESLLDGLAASYSENGLSLEDFERRADGVSKAADKAAMLALIADIPDIMPQARPKTSLDAHPSGWRVASDGGRERDSAVCIFGGTERRGVWAAPRSFDSLCVFGGANLDLRKAIMPPEGITIKCFAVFGGMEIIVPPDMRLEIRGGGIFGGFDHRENPDAPADAPVVRIEGFAVFGGVGIKIRD